MAVAWLKSRSNEEKAFLEMTEMAIKLASQSVYRIPFEDHKHLLINT